MSGATEAKTQDEATTPWQRLATFGAAAGLVIILAVIFEAKGWIPVLASVLVVATTHVIITWNTVPPVAGKEKRYSGILEAVRQAFSWSRYVLDRQNRGFEVAKGLGKGFAFVLLRWLTEHGLGVLLFTIPVGGHQIYVVIVAIILCATIFIIMPSASRYLKPFIADRGEDSETATTKPAPAPSLSKDS